MSAPYSIVLMAAFFYEIVKNNFSVRHAGPRDFPRRRGRVAGYGFCRVSQVVALFLREEGWFGEGNRQFTGRYRDHD